MEGFGIFLTPEDILNQPSTERNNSDGGDVVDPKEAEKEIQAAEDII